MNKQPDPADQWLAENDPLHNIKQEAEASREDVLNQHMSDKADSYTQGLTILHEQRKEVADTLES